MKYILEKPVVGSIGTEKFKTTVSWRNGVLITDEPVKLGGQDIGPDPYTLLLSSLISCTLATLRMYIDLKGLNIPDISVEANMFHRADADGLVLHIERQVDFIIPIENEIREKLLTIAENCPISKILKGTIRITTAVKEN